MSQFRLIAIACTGSLLTACAEPELIGVWESVDEGEGAYYFGHMAYLEDGRKCTVLFEYVNSEVETTAFINQWSRDGDVVTLAYGPSNSSIPEGYTSRSRIQELTESRYVYEIIDSAYAEGEVGRKVRLTGVDPYRVCGLAYEILGMPEGSGSDKDRT